MLITKIIKTVFLLICIGTCLTPVMASDFVMRVFGETEGLEASTINDISFDSHGFVWVATEQGLFRLSNSKIRRIDKVAFDLRLSGEYINMVEPLSDQHLLVSNYADTYLYDMLQNKFVRFGSESLFPDYKGGGIIAQVKEGDHYIFLTLDGELLQYSYEKTSLERINFLPTNADIPWGNLVALDDGRIIVGTEYELQLRDSQGLRIAVFPWGEEYGLMKQLFKDSLGRIWLSSSEGVYRVYADTLKIEPVEALSFYATNIAEDNEGSFWISGRVGLIKWKPGDTEYQIYKEQLKQDADMDYIYDIEIDDSGLIWVGGAGEGLAIVTSEPDFLLDTYTTSSPYSMSNEMIWGTYGEGERVWFGTDNGLILIDRQAKTSTSLFPQGLELNDSIYSVESLDAAHLLLATTNGLFVVNKATFTAQRFAQWTHGDSSLEHKIVFATYEDPLILGRWWFMTSTGLYFWEPGLFNPQSMPVFSGGLNPRIVDIRTVIRDESGKLWLGGTELFGYLDNEGEFHSKLDKFSDGSSEMDINYIEEIDSDTFWLGTSPKGLIEYSLDSDDARELNKEWEIDCNSVYFIQKTADFRLIGCPKSMLRYTKSTEEIMVLGHDDGLLGDELNDGSFFYDPREGLYVGTPDGAMLLDVDNLANRILRDGVFLETVSVFYDEGVQIDLIPQDEKIIKPGARMISFQITSLDYLDDTPMTLQYRLKREGDISEAKFLLLDGQSQLNITGLQSGKYTLEILSQENGIWSDKPYRFSFAVKHYWWQMTWVKSLLLLILLCICGGVIFYRQRQVQAFKLINAALVESEERLRQSLKGRDEL